MFSFRTAMVYVPLAVGFLLGVGFQIAAWNNLNEHGKANRRRVVLGWHPPLGREAQSFLTPQGWLYQRLTYVSCMLGFLLTLALSSILG